MLLPLVNVQQRTTVFPFDTAAVMLLSVIISLINFLTDIGRVNTNVLTVDVCLP